MKQYEKQYEDYFRPERREQYLDMDDVSTDIGLDAYEYADLMKSELYKYERQLFDIFVKYHWLICRFHYLGKPRLNDWANGTYVDTAFGMFMRNYADCNKEFFTGRNIHRITTYFKDFFPNFHLYDPIKEPEKYKFPYDNISLSFLLVVYQVDERLELLDYADKQNMAFPDFVNYVINQVFCINEDLGYNKYSIGFSEYRTLYIKNADWKGKGTNLGKKAKK